jgi:hypothetical protein
LMAEHNVYRGKVISLSGSTGPMGMSIDVAFHRRKPAAREQIVLPAGLLERVERSTIEFDRHTEALRERGHHLRRGILLHGPPGTGKTLTATYLTDVLDHRTVLILTGRSLGLIQATCKMARDLQPSMVILEDIDLVAQERTQMGANTTALLFELLNEIDGMGEEADVIFVMTTNRADLLEPALASRPGRVDQAVDFPLPDPASRGRLLELFCEGLDVDLPDPAEPGVPARAGAQGWTLLHGGRREHPVRAPLRRGAGGARRGGPAHAQHPRRRHGGGAGSARAHGFPRPAPSLDRTRANGIDRPAR